MSEYSASRRPWPVALVAALGVLLLSAVTVSAEVGVIEGKLRNGTAGATAPSGLPVALEKVGADGASTVVQQVKTDVDGSFRFAAVDATAGYTYALSAQYQDVTYRTATGALDAAGAAKPVELTVFETTDSDAAIAIDLGHAVLQPDEQNQGIWAIEVLVLNNTGDRTYVGDPRTTVDGKRPTLRFSLPPGVHGAEPMQGLDEDDIFDIANGFAATSPVLPGQRSVAYSYMIASEGQNLTYSRALDYPTKRFAVLMADTGGRVEAVGMAQGKPAELGGQRYQTYIAEGLSAGDSLMLRQSSAVASGGSTMDLTIAVGGVAVFAIALGLVVYLRKRQRVAVAQPALAVSSARERLMAAIADLDDAFEAGEIEEEEYRAERAVRKKRLGKLTQAVQAEG